MPCLRPRTNTPSLSAPAILPRLSTLTVRYVCSVPSCLGTPHFVSCRSLPHVVSFRSLGGALLTGGGGSKLRWHGGQLLTGEPWWHSGGGGLLIGGGSEPQWHSGGGGLLTEGGVGELRWLKYEVAVIAAYPLMRGLSSLTGSSLSDGRNCKWMGSRALPFRPSFRGNGLNR